MIDIPKHFFDVAYNGSRFPGAPDAIGLDGGANCQHFSYELLRYFGKMVPNLRSKEIWEDEEYTEKVDTLEPLDIVLFNKNIDAWGAHMGVYLGDGNVIHLSKVVGYPVIWPLEQFRDVAQYAVFIGAKRIKN